MSFVAAYGASSSRMVVFAMACRIAAPVAVVSRSENVSLLSGIVSPFTLTSMVFFVSPGAKVSVPAMGT